MPDEQQKEIERLRKENAALRARATATDPPLTFRHKPTSEGGHGVLGIYGIWKPTKHDQRTLQLYPNQLRRLRRDIDRGMQYVIDNIDEMSFRTHESRLHFKKFHKYLKDQNLFRIHE